jgi:integrase
MKSIVDKLLESGRWRQALMLAIPSYLLIRFSDYVHLKWIDFESDRIIMREQKTQKTKKVRNIKLGNEIRELVKKAKPAEANSEDYIFRNSFNCPLSIQFINAELKKIKDEFNIPVQHFSTHSLLKTGCLRVFENKGKSDSALMLICRIRNHSNPGITLNYLNLGQGAIDEAYESL